MRKPSQSPFGAAWCIAFALMRIGVCADAPLENLDDSLRKAVDLYRAKDYSTALNKLHAVATSAGEADRLDEYVAKAKEALGDELGKILASCRLLTKCRRCKGEGCPTCKTCKGLGCRHKKRQAKTRVNWTEVEQVGIARVMHRKRRDIAVGWTEVRACRRCKGRGCRPCRTCNGTGWSLVKTGGSANKTPGVLDIERSYLADGLKAKAESALRQVDVVDRQGKFRKEEVDAQDIVWVLRAGKCFEQAAAIVTEPADKVQLGQKAQAASLKETKFLEVLKRRWEAAADRARRQAEAELRRQADEELARHKEERAAGTEGEGTAEKRGK